MKVNDTDFDTDTDKIMNEDKLFLSNNCSVIDHHIDNGVVGFMLIWTSSMAVLAYVPVLYVMCTSKLLKAPCYSFMLSLGISDVICLFGWIILGIHTVTDGKKVSNTLTIIVGCILVIGWGNLSVHLAMIAASIYVAVCHPMKQTNLFSWKRVKQLLTFCWFYAVVVHASPTFIPPNMEYKMDSYILTWHDVRVRDYYSYEDPIFVCIVVAVCLFCYLSIIVKYTTVRKRVTPKNGSTDSLSTACSNSRRQFKLALQTAIRFATFFIYDILYYVKSDDSEAKLYMKFVFCTYLWCLNNALSPFIYLAFNMQIRIALKNCIVNVPILNSLVVRERTRNVSIKSSNGDNSGKY